VTVQKLPSLVAALLWTVIASFSQCCRAADLRSQTVIAGSVAVKMTIYSNGDDLLSTTNSKVPPILSVVCRITIFATISEPRMVA
jgi:hypothetical protein